MCWPEWQSILHCCALLQNFTGVPSLSQKKVEEEEKEKRKKNTIAVHVDCPSGGTGVPLQGPRLWLATQPKRLRPLATLFTTRGHEREEQRDFPAPKRSTLNFRKIARQTIYLARLVRRRNAFEHLTLHVVSFSVFYRFWSEVVLARLTANSIWMSCLVSSNHTYFSPSLSHCWTEEGHSF